jgi:hypothetical protein
VTESKTEELIRDINRFAESRFDAGNFVEAEERFRTAIDVYTAWCAEDGTASSAVLSSIAGLVRSLEAQGRVSEAIEVLEQYDKMVAGIIRALRERII